MQETWLDSWVRKICWRRNRLPTPVLLGFPRGSAGKESTCNVGDLGSIPGWEDSPGEGNDYSLQYSGLENSMDCRAYGVTKSQTQLSDFHFYFHITDTQICQQTQDLSTITIKTEFLIQDNTLTAVIPLQDLIK